MINELLNAILFFKNSCIDLYIYFRPMFLNYILNIKNNIIQDNKYIFNINGEILFYFILYFDSHHTFYSLLFANF